MFPGRFSSFLRRFRSFPAGEDGGDARAFDYVIGVSLANLTEPWRINMRDEIMAEASRHGNLRVVFTDAADSSNRQIQDVNTLLASGIDLLIISPNDAEALTPVIARAYRSIPVILLDRSVVGFDYTLFIGPDNRLIGKQAGQYVSELLGAKGGKIVEILGRSGSPPVLDRSLGFQDAISHRRNITIVDTIVADWLRDKAEDELTAWLKKRRPRGRHLRPERRHGGWRPPGSGETGDQRHSGGRHRRASRARTAASRWCVEEISPPRSPARQAARRPSSTQWTSSTAMRASRRR